MQDVKPTHGNKFAVVGTGLGEMLSKDNFIQTTIQIPEGKTKLLFDYDMISEEPLEWIEKGFDDKLCFYISSKSNPLNVTNPEPVLMESVNGSKWLELGGNYFAGGDDTTYHTGMKTYEIDLSKFIADGSFTFTVMLWDEGDSAFDSAVALDNLRFE